MRKTCLHGSWILPAAWLAMIGCKGPNVPTRVPAATVPPATETAAAAEVPATWTLDPAAAPPSPTAADLPTRAPRSTQTPFPTFTSRPSPSGTPSPSPSATSTDAMPMPSTPVPAPDSQNHLPNPSFENGWYHVNGIPELQVPAQWTFEWDEGPNSLDPDPWNVFVRPESRVLHADFLPPHEHSLFIWDGEYTVKIFKEYGALSFRLLTDVYLEPGSYLLEVNVFPDMVDHYLPSGQKVWAPDPLSAELRFLTGAAAGNWIFPTFGQKNSFQHTFEVTESGWLRLGVALRGRWAIANNGWFLDDWSLHRLAAASAS